MARFLKTRNCARELLRNRANSSRTFYPFNLPCRSISAVVRLRRRRVGPIAYSSLVSLPMSLFFVISSSPLCMQYVVFLPFSISSIRRPSVHCPTSSCRRRRSSRLQFDHRAGCPLPPPCMYRARLIGGPQVWWILFLLLLTTSASTCLQHSRNLGPAY